MSGRIGVVCRSHRRSRDEAHALPVLWRHPVPIARIQRGLADVRQSEDLGRQSFQADGQATVWRHPRVEHPEVIFKRGWIKASSTQCTLEVFAPVEPLAARRDLE